MKLIILRLATPGFNTPSLRDLFAKQIVEFEDYTDGEWHLWHYSY